MEKQSAVAILIDEIQDFKEKELSALIMACLLYTSMRSRKRTVDGEAYRNLILRRFRSGMRLSCTVGIPSTRA